MPTLVEVHPDSHLPQCRIGLRRPRRSRLPVADRRHTEDSLDVAYSVHLPAMKLVRSVLPAHMLQVDGRRRLPTVQVRMVPDLVPLQRRNHIATTTLLKHARLLSDELEIGRDSQPRQHLCQPQRRVIALRQHIVFGIEPEGDVKRRFIFLRPIHCLRRRLLRHHSGHCQERH